MQVDGCRGSCIDASRVHDFHGSAANPSQNGTLRHPDINLVLSHRVHPACCPGGRQRPRAMVQVALRLTAVSVGLSFPARTAPERVAVQATVRAAIAS